MRRFSAAILTALGTVLGLSLVACGDGDIQAPQLTPIGATPQLTPVGEVPQLTAVAAEVTEISDLSPGANADVTLEWGVPRPNPDVVAADILVPSGWQIAPGATVPVGDEIGSGNLVLDAGCDRGFLDEFPFTLKAAAGEAGEKAHWLAEIEGSEPLELSVTGTRDDGHIISMSLLTEADAPRGCPAVIFELLLLARSSSGATLLTNPEETGDYRWEVKVYTVPPPAEPAAQVGETIRIGEQE